MIYHSVSFLNGFNGASFFAAAGFCGAASGFDAAAGSCCAGAAEAAV